MFTLNNILQEFENFQTNHKQINSFFFGDAPFIGASHPELYPLLFCELKPVSSSTDENTEVFNFDFAVLDIPNKSEEEINVREILSDTKRIANDFVAFLKYTKFSEGLTIQLPVLMSAIEKAHDDNAYGWAFTLPIKVSNELDLCGIPYSGYTPPASYNKAFIQNQFGTVIATLNMGQTYTVEQLQEIIQTLTDPAPVTVIQTLS